MYGYGRPPMGNRGYGVDVNGDGIADYRVKPGVGVDVNGDGIADYRTGPQIQPGPGMYMGRPPMGGGMYGPPMGNRGYGVDVNGDGIPDYRVKPGVGVDVNGDGIADYRTGPQIQPGPGMYMGGPHYGGYRY